MSKSSTLFNVISSPPMAQRATPPWPAIVATLVFVFVVGQDMETHRQKLVSLRYALPQENMSSPNRLEALATPGNAALSAVSAELTYPWDSVLNLLGAENDAIRLLTLDANSDGSPNHLRIRALQTADFWAWLALLKKNPAVASASAVSVQSQDNEYVFDVAIRWRRP